MAATRPTWPITSSSTPANPTSTYDPLTNYVTAAGAFTNRASAYGTLDQSGLVYEWYDLEGTTATHRGLRGGYRFSAGQSAISTSLSWATPERESNDAGFRLADPMVESTL